MNFVRFLNTPFFTEHLWWLLLYHIAKANQIEFSFQVSKKHGNRKHNNLISHKGQKRGAFTEFQKAVAKFAIENSNRSAAQKFSVEPKRLGEWRE